MVRSTLPARADKAGGPPAPRNPQRDEGPATPIYRLTGVRHANTMDLHAFGTRAERPGHRVRNVRASSTGEMMTMRRRTAGPRNRRVVRRWAALGTPPVFVLAAVVLVASPASASPVEVGGIWHLDDATGATIAVDSSGSGNSGVIRGRVLAGQPGYMNTSFLFDGGWIEVAHSETMNPGSRDFTASAYLRLVRLPLSGETFDIIRKGTAGVLGGEFKLEIGTAGKVRCIAQGITPAGTRITARAITPKANLADGLWHQVRCSRTGSTWTARVDGITRSVTANLGSIGNAKPVAIGAKYGQEDYTRGHIDELRLEFMSP